MAHSRMAQQEIKEQARRDKQFADRCTVILSGQTEQIKTTNLLSSIKTALAELLQAMEIQPSNLIAAHSVPHSPAIKIQMATPEQALRLAQLRQLSVENSNSNALIHVTYGGPRLDYFLKTAGDLPNCDWSTVLSEIIEKLRLTEPNAAICNAAPIHGYTDDEGKRASGIAISVAFAKLEQQTLQAGETEIEIIPVRTIPQLIKEIETKRRAANTLRPAQQPRSQTATRRQGLLQTPARPPSQTTSSSQSTPSSSEISAVEVTAETIETAGSNDTHEPARSASSEAASSPTRTEPQAEPTSDPEDPQARSAATHQSSDALPETTPKNAQKRRKIAPDSPDKQEESDDSLSQQDLPIVSFLNVKSREGKMMVQVLHKGSSKPSWEALDVIGLSQPQISLIRERKKLDQATTPDQINY
ncbi:MAG: hypothetical protein ACK8QZ_07470 [Anaerolineales bacterium]